MASNAATLQKLQYQLKKAETDVEGWKRKEKAKRDEFLALQQGVTNKQKQLQQRINRLEQEVLEGKRARDVLQREYQVTLQQVIDLGKADDKSALLAQTVERQASELSELRAISEANASLAKDWETKALANQTACDLARTEKEAAVRAAEETEVAARQVRELLKEERSGAGAGVGAGAGGKPLKGKTCLVFGGGSSANGRSVTRHLVEQGARVGVADSNETEAQKLAKELRDVGGDVAVLNFDEFKFAESAKLCCEHFAVSTLDGVIITLLLPEEKKTVPEVPATPEIEFDKSTASISRSAFTASNQLVLFSPKKGKIISLIAHSTAPKSVAQEMARASVANVTSIFSRNYAEKGLRFFSVAAGKSDNFCSVVSFLCSDASDGVSGIDFSMLNSE